MDKPKGDFEAWPLYAPSRTKSWLSGPGCESDQLRLTHRDENNSLKIQFSILVSCAWLGIVPSTKRLAHGCYHHDTNQGSAK